MNSQTELVDYHKNRTILDTKFINSVFETDERDRLKQLQQRYPNYIIRMPNADLIATGFISGIGGSVPAGPMKLKPIWSCDALTHYFLERANDDN